MKRGTIDTLFRIIGLQDLNKQEYRYAPVTIFQ